jgi:hypothetical protein
MAVLSRSALVGKFQASDMPTASDYVDVFDSLALESQFQIVSGRVTRINLGSYPAVTRASGAQSSGATSLVVDSTANFKTGDTVGYQRGDGVYERRTVTVTDGTHLGVAAIGGNIDDDEVLALIPAVIEDAESVGDSVGDYTLRQTIEHAMAGIYNVYRFGAVADGSSHPLSDYYATLPAAQVDYPHAVALTDERDWAAIQAAVNAARGSTFFGIIYLPPGGYMVNRTITGIANQIMVAGAGRQASRIYVANNYSGAVFTDAGVEHAWVCIRDLTVRAINAIAPDAIMYLATGRMIEGIFENLHTIYIGTPIKGTFGDTRVFNCKFVFADKASIWLTGGYTGGRTLTVALCDLEQATYGIYVDESSGQLGELHLTDVKFETTYSALYRNLAYVVEKGCSYSVGTYPPLVCESVARYEGNVGDKWRGQQPHADLNDLDLPNLLADGDMALSGTAAWTGSNVTLVKLGDNIRGNAGIDYIIGAKRKHAGILEVLPTAANGYVQQTLSNLPSQTRYFFTCSYAVENGNTCTIEVLDNASTVMLRKQAIAGADPYVPQFYRLSGSFDAGAATSLTVRITSHTDAKKVWLDEIVLCSNLVRRTDFAVYSGTGTLTTADTTAGRYYTEPAALTFDKSTTNAELIRSQAQPSGSIVDGEDYLVWARIQIPDSTDPTMRVYLVDNSADAPFIDLNPDTDGWVEVSRLVRGDSIDGEYWYIGSQNGASGWFYLDACAVVALGSKHSAERRQGQYMGRPDGQYTIVQGSPIDISAANASALLYYPTEHYQLHKIELIYSVAPDNTNNANIKIGTTGDDDYYTLTNVKGTEAQWARRAVVPLKSDVRRGTPIMVDWVQNASQTATVIPVLYLK